MLSCDKRFAGKMPGNQTCVNELYASPSWKKDNHFNEKNNDSTQKQEHCFLSALSLPVWDSLNNSRRYWTSPLWPLLKMLKWNRFSEESYGLERNNKVLLIDTNKHACPKMQAI